MTDKTLETLFHDMLKDVYYAENKIYKTLPKMAKATQSTKLAAAFEKHQKETEVQIERLERVFDILGKKPQAKKCPAIDGILEEGGEIMKEYKKSKALDAGLIASAQAVEHYEIARYGTLRRWAEALGMKDAAALLLKTLEEEGNTDESLNLLAYDFANKKALPRAA